MEVSRHWSQGLQNELPLGGGQLPIVPYDGHTGAPPVGTQAAEGLLRFMSTAERSATIRVISHDESRQKARGRRQSRRKYWEPIVLPIRNDRNQSPCLNLSQSKPWGSARSIGLIVPCATTMLRLILRR